MNRVPGRPSGMRADPIVRAGRWIAVVGLVLVTPGVALAETPTGPASAEVECARQAALRVQGHYEKTRDLSARFYQRTRRVALGSMDAAALEARGEVVFAKPGRMRWTYEVPEQSVVVSDGETLWIYDPAAREAQHLPLGPSFLSGAAIQFLLGQGRILEQFEVSARECGDSEAHLVLTPRSDAPYERLEVLADVNSGVIRETTVVDLLGNETRVAFEKVKTDTEPDPALFRFEPPEGTRVIELPQPAVSGEGS